MRMKNILLSLGATLPIIAFTATSQEQPFLERQLNHMNMKSEATPLSSALTFNNGVLTVGKFITYDFINHSPYDGQPADMSTPNAVFIGYSGEAPLLGNLSNLTTVKGLTLYRRISTKSTPIPEANLMCNLGLFTSNQVTGVTLGEYYFPLTQVSSSTRDGITYYDYLAIAPNNSGNGSGYEYVLELNAFCTTFESFNSTYPNGATVPVTLIP